MGAGGAAAATPGPVRGASGAVSVRVGLKRFRSATTLNAVSGDPGAAAAGAAATSAVAGDAGSVVAAGARAAHAS